MSGVVCVVCPCAGDENLKKFIRSSIIRMKSYTSQYLRSSTPLNLSPSLSLFFVSPFFCFFSISFFFLSFLPPLFPSFLPTFCVCVCVYLRMYVRLYLAIACVSAHDNVEHIKSNIRYLFDKKSSTMK